MQFEPRATYHGGHREITRNDPAGTSPTISKLLYSPASRAGAANNLSRPWKALDFRTGLTHRTFAAKIAKLPVAISVQKVP